MNDTKQKRGLTRKVPKGDYAYAGWDEIYQRIVRESNGKTSRADFSAQFEETVYEWNPSDPTDFGKLYGMLKVTIESKAKKFERKFHRRTGLTSDDFESVMWEKAWLICQDYNQYMHDNFAFPVICTALDNVALDLLRHECQTKQGEFERSAVRLTDRNCTPASSPESAVTAFIVVEQIMNDPALTAEERLFLQILRDYPHLSLRQISIRMGHRNHKQTQRLRERIQSKLAHYAKEWR